MLFDALKLDPSNDEAASALVAEHIVRSRIARTISTRSV